MMVCDAAHCWQVMLDKQNRSGFFVGLAMMTIAAVLDAEFHDCLGRQIGFDQCRLQSLQWSASREFYLVRLGR